MKAVSLGFRIWQWPGLWNGHADDVRWRLWGYMDDQWHPRQKVMFCWWSKV